MRVENENKRLPLFKTMCLITCICIMYTVYNTYYNIKYWQLSDDPIPEQNNIHFYQQIVFNKSNMDRNNIVDQWRLNQYVDRFVLRIKELSSAAIKNITLDKKEKVSFSLISKQFIIDNLANKTILFFGDSLPYYLASFLIHAIYWCMSQINVECPCLTFCDNLEQNTLYLDGCSFKLLVKRENLWKILSYTDSVGTFLAHRTSSIYFSNYNITIYLYYHWGTDLKTVDTLIQDFRQLVSNSNITFDLILNNILSMHLPKRPKKIGNVNLSLSMIDNIEHYMNIMTKTTQAQSLKLNKTICLIYGPVNPTFGTKYVEDYSLNLLSIQTRVLFKKYFLSKYNESDLNKILSLSYTDATKYLSLDIAAPSILSYLPAMYGQTWSWENHLNYNIINYTNDTEWAKIEKGCCSELDEYIVNNTISFSNYDIKNINEETKNVILSNICLLYPWGLGNNMFHHRMKDFVENYFLNYNSLHSNYSSKFKLFYHDQYTLYQAIDKLHQYRVNGIHYPQFQKIAWTNILNIVSNGCYQSSNLL